MRAWVAGIGFGLMLLPTVLAQQGTAAAALAPCVAGARPSFDVSSVKPSQTSSNSSSMRSRPDGLTATGALKRLILNAYGLQDFQLSGGPDWVNTSTWEVAAKIDPPDTAPTKADMAAYDAWNERRMGRLQSLLADRFALKCHMTAKELPVYELIIAKSGSKLKETTAEEGKRGSMNVNGDSRKNQMVATGVDLKTLAKTLAGDVGRSVIDKTGLAGSYDLTLAWAADTMRAGQPADTDAASGPTLFTAVEEQLGLKLVAAKGPVDVLVIDGVEKPGEN